MHDRENPFTPHHPLRAIAKELDNATCHRWLIAALLAILAAATVLTSPAYDLLYASF